MQHLEPHAQVAAKQRVLEDNLWHIGKVRPEMLLRPIYGQTWGYRHRARLSVRLVPKKGGVLVGFHERKSSFVADMSELRSPAAAHFRPAPCPCASLIAGLSMPTRLPQIELAVGEEVTVLVLRILDPLSPRGRGRAAGLRGAARHPVLAADRGPDTAQPFYPQEAPPLYYSLPEFGVQIHFRPTDFTQVNHAVNRILVRRAMDLLDPRPGERIADLFCGLGNFSLPIASRGARGAGRGRQCRAGAAGRRQRAPQRACRERALSGRQFVRGGELRAVWRQRRRFDKLLIDPPRDGAVELVKALEPGGPRRIVYVSCDPATLARDAGVLVHVKGYRLAAAGVINMFPHTSHVESIALFESDHEPAAIRMPIPESTNEKGGRSRPFLHDVGLRLSRCRRRAQQLQQAGEQVVDRDIQPERRR